MALALTLTVLSLFVSILVAYYFYRKSRKEKEPVCLYENTTLEPKIPIRYGDKSIDRITRTHLAFWNNGREPIQKSDIIGCLEIVFEPPAEVLEAAVVKPSRGETGFKVTPIGEVGGKPTSRVNITFDFLDKGDGASIEILHTGKENTKPTFEGAIVGAPQGIVVNDASQTMPLLTRTLLFVVPLGCVIGVGVGIILWKNFSFWADTLAKWYFYQQFMGIGGALSLLAYILFVYLKKRSETQPPKILR